MSRRIAWMDGTQGRAATGTGGTAGTRSLGGEPSAEPPTCRSGDRDLLADQPPPLP